MSNIHPTAIVSEKATIHPEASVGPYCVVGDNVTLNRNVKLLSHVTIHRNTKIDEGTVVYPFAVLGFKPQDLKFGEEETYLAIGKNNEIREFTSIHLATAQNPTLTTKVGDNCLIMGSVHIAHDCQLGNNIVIANTTVMGGHCVLDDYVIVGGACAIHQFSRIGTMSFIGGGSLITEDILPYAMYTGGRDTGVINGINMVGLKRKGFNASDIRSLKKAYELVFSEGKSLQEKSIELQKNFEGIPVIEPLISFLKDNGKTSRIMCMNYRPNLRGA